ncbi:MAG: dihydrolipoamide acetyltransferase family protein [Pseudomonadota bacterium]
MGEHLIKLPDVGEGVAEAELVEWLVEDGQNVREDDVLAAVMTDKATVEIPSPVEGKIIWRGAQIGEIVAVGAPIIRLQVDGPGNISPGAEPAKPSEPQTENVEPLQANGAAAPETGAKAATPSPAHAPVKKTRSDVAVRKEGESPLASPAVRRRALDGGVDLRRVPGSGPAGRIMHDDLDDWFESGGVADHRGLQADLSVSEAPVIGLRRKIAEQMRAAHERIVPITYVDEVDVTALEDARRELNNTRKENRPKLTILPFIMRALVKAIGDHPHMNAIFDDEAGVIRRHGGVHIGVAAQTPNGLMVPVVRHCEARDIWACADEVARLSEAAKSGKASRDELSGSTITITSLGALGGIVTTPVINYPEVAIIGVNKMQVKPVWDGAEFRPRKVMNLSSSFDHRVIDGWDAAVFVQRIKQLLETPAMIFVTD